MKLGAIEKELLLPGMERARRKARIRRYLDWVSQKQEISFRSCLFPSADIAEDLTQRNLAEASNFKV